MGSRPKTSTARVALDVSGAALDLIERDLPDADAYELVKTILEDGRDLQPYQVEDVLGFLRERLDLDGVGSEVPPGERETG